MSKESGLRLNQRHRFVIRRHWIEIALVDFDGGAVPGERFELTSPDEVLTEGTLSDAGEHRAEFPKGGTCEVHFPDRDVVLSEVTEPSWLEIVALDSEDQPLADEPFEVTLPDGTVEKGKLDADGRFRIDDVLPGICEVVFPNRDARDAMEWTS